MFCSYCHSPWSHYLPGWSCVPPATYALRFTTNICGLLQGDRHYCMRWPPNSTLPKHNSEVVGEDVRLLVS